MLMKSGINPFDSQEAKPYKNDPEILAMTNLVSAYQNNDINDFEKILKQNRQTIMDDPFIREHIEDLLRNIRTQVRCHCDSTVARECLWSMLSIMQVLIKLIRPYTRIKISFISGQLNIDSSDVESLLVSCILDNTIKGRIDQVRLSLTIAADSYQLFWCHRFEVFWNSTKSRKAPLAIVLWTSGANSWRNCRKSWLTKCHNITLST